MTRRRTSLRSRLVSVLAAVIACSTVAVLATVAPAEAATFSNSAPITTVLPGCAQSALASTLYPSNITVSGSPAPPPTWWPYLVTDDCTAPAETLTGGWSPGPHHRWRRSTTTTVTSSQTPSTTGQSAVRGVARRNVVIDDVWSPFQAHKKLGRPAISDLEPLDGDLDVDEILRCRRPHRRRPDVVDAQRDIPEAARVAMLRSRQIGSAMSSGRARSSVPRSSGMRPQTATLSRMLGSSRFLSAGGRPGLAAQSVR